LNHWKRIYVAGRLQKPVQHCHQDNFTKSIVDPVLEAAMQRNLRTCVLYALLLLKKETFSIYEFYKALLSVSYKGDLRMIIAESPQKLDNMLIGYYSLTSFEENSFDFYGDRSLIAQWYSNVLSLLSFQVEKSGNSHDPLIRAQETILSIDPFSMYQLMMLDLALKPSFYPRFDLIYRCTTSGLIQSIKGIFTAGPIQATRYLFRKMSKRF
jgi:Phosphatidate cytidylyltransferase, mitochondrial